MWHDIEMICLFTSAIAALDFEIWNEENQEKGKGKENQESSSVVWTLLRR